MKDKKRRTYGFLTGLLLILSVCLTSCGNQGQTDSGKDSNTQSGTKVAAEDHSAEEKGSDSESYVTVDKSSGIFRTCEFLLKGVQAKAVVYTLI